MTVSRIVCLLLVWTGFSLLLISCRKKTLFERLDSSQTGIAFANTITESDSLNVLDFEYIYNGGGVGVGDVNNDGLPDVFFSGNQVPSRLYINRSTPGRSAPERGTMRFEDVTERAGITHKSWSTGVSMVDINADGLLDIYVCTANPKRGAPGAPNVFYINEGIGKDGLPHFSDRATEMGLADRGYSTQAAFLDYDRDGDLDVYLLTNALEGYNRNQPRGPVRDGSGKSTDRLYRNERVKEIKSDRVNERKSERVADGSDSLRFGGPIHSLTLSLFKDVSHEAGITIEGWGLGVAVADFNDDGWPDVYCANDFQSNDLLWINNRNGTFTNRLGDYMKHQSHNAMGVDVADLNNDGYPELMTLDMMPDDNRRQKSMFGAQNVDRHQMGLERGYSNQYVRNVLQLNRGPMPGNAAGADQTHPTFSEVGQLSGVSATDWSWSTLMADFDNDGFRDIFITNGYPKDITDLDFMAYNNDHQSSYFDSDSRTEAETKAKIVELLGVKKSNFMYRNRGGDHNGEPLTFEDVTTAWGLSIPSFSNGAAYADFDNDGDLDIVVNTINDRALVYANRTTERTDGAGKDKFTTNHYLRVVLAGDAGNPAGFGAKVDLRYRDRDTTRHRQAIEQSPYRGYQSTVEPTLHFGLGTARRVDTLLVRWPDRRVSRLTNLPADQVVTVRQRDAKTEPESSPTLRTAALFEELTRANPVLFVQQENQYVDFKQQVLLPHRYSQNGPGMAVGDVDGNGLDDVFIGGASTFDGTLFRQTAGADGPERFIRQPITGVDTRKMADDMGAVFFDADGDKDLDLYVVAGGNEWLANQRYYQDRLYINERGRFRQDTTALPDTRASGSCVVAADYDRDGDMDLFVGGRVAPHQYPLPGRSYLLQNNNGRFTDVTNQIAPGLAEIGMVTSALWSDYDNDGQIDLVIAGEFMPVTFFRNQNGRLRIAQTGNHPATRTSARGWWNSLTAGDFDNDGDIDYVAGNLGLNSRFKVSETEPLTVHAKDYDQNGTLDPIMCCYIQGKRYPAHPRDQLAEQVPGLKKRFTSYAAYGRMTFDQLLKPEETQGAYVATATEFRSCYFENRGKAGFLIRPLPMLAQMAPVFGMLTDDYDGDGNLDLLLAGNSYATDVQVGRYDAGKGLLLRGDGRGGFTPETMARSGFCADRDAKSLVAVATGQPGQSLILMGNNSDTLQTFRRSKPSLKAVRLRADEYAAFWKRPDGRTHRAEVYSGSGYLSQSSRVLTVGQPAGPVTVLNYRGQRRSVAE